MKPGGVFALRVRRGEIGAAVVIAALGAAVITMALRMPDGSMGAPGPGMFPLGLGGGLLLSFAAEAEQVTADDVVAALLRAVPWPSD